MRRMKRTRLRCGRVGIEKELTTGMLLFGGFGSKVMLEIVEQLDAAKLPLQWCDFAGKNDKLAEAFRRGNGVCRCTSWIHQRGSPPDAARTS